MKGGKTSRPLVLGGGGPQGQDGGQQGQGQGGPAGGGQGGARNGARGVTTMGGGRGQPVEEWNNAPVVSSVTEGQRLEVCVGACVPVRSVPLRREMW